MKHLVPIVLVNHDISQVDVQKLHLQRTNQQPVNDFAPPNLNYEIKRIRSIGVCLHSFIVDWQVCESEKDEKMQVFLPG